MASRRRSTRSAAAASANHPSMPSILPVRSSSRSSRRAGTAAASASSAAAAAEITQEELSGVLPRTRSSEQQEEAAQVLSNINTSKTSQAKKGRTKRASRQTEPDDVAAATAAATAAAAPAAIAAEASPANTVPALNASGRPSRRSTQRSNYVEASSESEADTEDEPTLSPTKGLHRSTMDELTPAINHLQDTGDAASDGCEAAAEVYSSSSSEDAAISSSDDDDDFLMTPEEKKKKKSSKRRKKSVSSRRSSPVKRVTASAKKATASSRKKTGVMSMPPPHDAAIDLSSSPPELAATSFVTSIRQAAASATKSSMAASSRDSDSDSVVEIDAFVPTASHKMHRAVPLTAASNGAGAAAAWSSMLKPLPATAAGKSHSNKPLKSKPTLSENVLSQAEKNRRVSTLSDMLGHCESATKATLVRYLEGAAWQVDAAACNVMDAPWYKSSFSEHPAGSSAAAAELAAVVKPAARTHLSHDAVLIDDDDNDVSATAASNVAAPKRKSAAAASASSESASKRPRVASAARSLSSSNSDDGALDSSLLAITSTAPPSKPISWERMLLLVLNVTAMSTTSGKNVLQTDDVLEFRREPFDLDGWMEAQRQALEEKERAKAVSDAAANERSIAGASSTGTKKKPALSRGKSKNTTAAAAALVKKRPPRVLRFAKRGADASHLELGSVPKILSDLLAPLFDSGCVELESKVLYVPSVLHPFDSITISLSVFVLPKLFTYRPPTALVDDAPTASENPFFRKIYAKKAAASTNWNPVEAFSTLLKECDVQPISSAEQELDQQAAVNLGETEGRTVAQPELVFDEGSTETKQGATISASSAAAMQIDDDSVLPASSEPDGAADGAADNNEGATVSKYQLNALYASAAAACATIPEADAPSNLRAALRPYQRQALYWMLRREAGDDALPPNVSTEAGLDGPARRKHPLWDEFEFADNDATKFYVNSFSHEVSLEFPEATGSCRGGILADEMGMGKTVMAIALMIANHPANVLLDPSENEDVQAEEQKEGVDGDTPDPKSDDGEIVEERKGTGDDNMSDRVVPSLPAAASTPAGAPSFFDIKSSRRHRRKYMLRDGVSGCTLVVCPMSLLSQWRDEIARFSDLEALVYYGSAKDRRRVAFHEHDVILTSYGVVAAEYRAVQTAQNAANAAALAAGHATAPISARQVATVSPLLSSHFWRILLDEGHIIRNRGTETAKAVFALRGVRRWVVSGTIIQNKLDDVFAPLRFLGEEPWCSWAWWNEVISKPFTLGNELALQRLRAILAPLMLRRTKSMRTASGESIVELPPKTEEIIECPFSEKEAEFYKAIYTRSRAQFDGFVASGSVMNKYIQILTLLLRLRQCADHPFLVLGRNRSGDEFDREIDEFIHKFGSRVDLAAPNAPSVGFLTALSTDLKKTGEERATCPICLCPPEIPVLTECAHLMCRECCTPLFNERGFARCPVCRSVISRDKLHYVPASSSADALSIDPVSNWQHSCKTSRLMSELASIRADTSDPYAKSIVFSQWTSMLDLVEIPLKQEGIQFVRLDGSLNQKEREQVLKRFSKACGPGVPAVLLLSLKAGGVGLNLTSANHVFFLDCWFNGAVEDQACQRVYRIGQTKHVFVKRLIVPGTVEERILALQQKKRSLAQSVAVSSEEQSKVKMADLVDLFRM